MSPSAVTTRAARIAGTMPDCHDAVNAAATTIRNHPAAADQGDMAMITSGNRTPPSRIRVERDDNL
jgi:hypothetical protein